MSGTDLTKDTPCRKDTSEKETFAVLISSNKFDIRAQYQSKENLAVLRLLMPQIIFHNAIYLVLILLEITTRFARRYFTIDIAMVANIIGACAVSIYNICSPLLLWCILQRQKTRRTRAIELLSKQVAHQDNIYFSNYAWNN
ncbi:unnamed protein product [Cylicocyclus nassatus]|uniref:Uncharacterized protein n=1 Tax=Cylicocyclus nassatus TaxID=53992 RepID=A0AA36M5Y7_CYLNA|nr:unnamed protein product [Cylicocyclus nassatus]